MGRRAQVAVTVAFLSAIALPLLLMVVGVRPENLENRGVTPVPEIDAGSLVDDGFYASISAALTDRLPLRDRAIRANTRLDDALSLTEPADPTQPRGEDGWLYHPDTLASECGGPPPARFLRAGTQVAKAAKNAGVPFLFIVAPDKVSIYPEHRPAEGLAGLLGLTGDDLPGCNRRWGQALANAAASRSWLDPMADDLRADLARTDEPLFYKLDTHWTDAGSLNQVEAMVEFLAPGLWDPAAVKPAAPDVKPKADMAILRGEAVEESVPGYLIERPGVTVRYDRAPPGHKKDRVDVSRAESTESPLIEGTTLLLGDSFSRHAMELLGPYFEEIIWVTREYLLRDDDLSELVDGPPRAVFVEQVRRNVAKGWYREYLRAARRYLRELDQ